MPVIPSDTRLKLSRLMRITSHAADDRTAVILGHPLPKVSWEAFVRIAVSEGIEVAKQITLDSSDRPVYSWRLVVEKPTALASALHRFTSSRMVRSAPQPVPPQEVVDCPLFGDLLHVYSYEVLDQEHVVYGMPIESDLPWAEAVVGLLRTGKVVDLSKVYFLDDQNLSRFIWRVIWAEDGAASGPALPPEVVLDITEKGRVLQADSGKPEMSKERVEEATDDYRARYGMVMDEKGRWRVPLDPYGRVTKAVLFNPERAAYVSGIDYSRTGTVTRAQLEGAERKP